MNKPEPNQTFDVREELGRIQLQARHALHPDELKEAVERLTFLFYALMDSFGIHTITVTKTLIAGLNQEQGSYIVSQVGHDGNVKQSVAVNATRLVLGA